MNFAASAQRGAPVGLIGVGLVGSALADRLLAAGQRVFGWDVDPQRLAELRQNGGEPATGPDDVFSQCFPVLLSAEQPRSPGCRPLRGRVASPRPHDRRHDHG